MTLTFASALVNMADMNARGMTYTALTDGHAIAMRRTVTDTADVRTWRTIRDIYRAEITRRDDAEDHARHEAEVTYFAHRTANI